jgi:hypothetical protein
MEPFGTDGDNKFINTKCQMESGGMALLLEIIAHRAFIFILLMLKAIMEKNSVSTEQLH